MRSKSSGRPGNSASRLRATRRRQRQSVRRPAAGHPLRIERQTVRMTRPDTEPSDRPPQLQGASRSTSQSGPRTHGRVKPRTDQTASSRRPPPAHRVPRLRRSARISSAARSRTASSDTAQSIHSGATRHSRHGVGAGLQANSTPSLPQPYRDGQALPHASSRTTGDRKASSCTPEGFEQTRRTPATTPVRYPAGHPVTHHVKRQTVRGCTTSL